jgi:hypothetical protein
MQLPTLSVDAVQDKFVVCVVPEGVKDVGAVGAAVSAVPVLILPYNLPLARKGMLRKQSDSIISWKHAFLLHLKLLWRES